MASSPNRPWMRSRASSRRPATENSGVAKRSSCVSRLEVAHADAEQAHGGARLLREPVPEQVRRDLRDESRLLRRRIEALLARVGLEVAPAHLDADHARLELLRAQPRRRAVRELREALLQFLVVADVDVEGFLGADLLLRRVGDDRPLVDARGAVLVLARLAPEQRPQHRFGRRPQLPEREDALFLEPRRGLRPDAEQPADRQRVEHRAHVLRADPREAVRLLHVGGELREQLVVRDADRGGEPGALADALLDLARHVLAAAEEADAARDVEEGLVEREPLDQVRELAEHLEHLARDFAVALEARAR